MQRKHARERSAFEASAFNPYFHFRYSHADSRALSKDSSMEALGESR